MEFYMRQPGIIENAYENLRHNVEIYRYKSSIKYLGKKYNISTNHRTMYFSIQKQLVLRMGPRSRQQRPTQEEYNKEVYCALVRAKVHQLNDEFYTITKIKMSNSFYALLRQLIELVIINKYINYSDPAFYKQFLSDGNPRVVYKRLLKKLEDFEPKFIKETLSPEWDLYSKMFHPSAKAFGTLGWSLGPIVDGRHTAVPLSKALNSSNLDNVLIIYSANFISSDQMTVMINRYFVYTHIILEELKKISGISEFF